MIPALWQSPTSVGLFLCSQHASLITFLRVTAESEVLGLDISQHGESFYEQELEGLHGNLVKEYEVKICTITVQLIIKELKTNHKPLNWVA